MKENILRAFFLCALSLTLLSGCSKNASPNGSISAPSVESKNALKKVVGNLRSDILNNEIIKDEKVETALNLFNKKTNKFTDIDYELYRAEDVKFKQYHTSEQKNESNRVSFLRAVHLERLNLFSIAYNQPDSVYYQSDSLKNTIESGLDFWLTYDPHTINWWWRMVGFPKRMATTALLMQEYLSKDLNDRAGKYLLWGWNNGGSQFSGANLMDVTNITMQGAALTENEAILSATVHIMDQYFTMMTTYPHPKNGEQRGAMDGLQVDYSYSQHGANGYQLYLAHYGIDYFKSVISFFVATDKTPYSFSAEKESLLENSFLISVPWIIFEGSFDENNTGRFIGAENVSSYIDLYAKVIAFTARSL